MDFLLRAQRYAEARGDYDYFANLYTLARNEMSVRESTRAALEYLYSIAAADLLEFQ